MKINRLATAVSSLLILFTAAFAFSSPCASADDKATVIIESTVGFGKQKVVVADFRKAFNFVDNEGRDKKMADILTDDLNFSGYFDVQRVGSIKGDPRGWASLGVEYVIQGSYTTDGKGMDISVEVTDTSNGNVAFAKTYTNALKLMRRKVHELSDDVILNLTGNKGVSTTKIAYVSDMTGDSELYLCDYDGHNIFRMTKDKSLCLLPAWTPGGTYIAFTSYRRVNADLWWVSTDGKKRGIISFYDGLNTAACWSPDGERLALSLTKDGNAEIYTMKRDATGLKRLTFSGAIDTSPTWSPTGKEIAFCSDRSGNPNIYVMDSNGGNVRRLTYQGKYNTDPDWSPKGDKIAFCGREGNYLNIYVMDVTGQNIVRLTYSQGNNEDPSWSPDGKHIVFSSTRSGVKALYTMDSDGKNVRRLNLPGNCQTPAWSPRM